MRIRYSLHALERLRQRGIPRGLVEDCIRDPESLEALDEGERLYRCAKRVGGKALVAVYRVTGDTVLVVTAYVTSKTWKYLRGAAEGKQ